MKPRSSSSWVWSDSSMPSCRLVRASDTMATGSAAAASKTSVYALALAPVASQRTRWRPACNVRKSYAYVPELTGVTGLTVTVVSSG